MSNYTTSPCPVGKYCPEGSEPVWCPAGRRRIIPQAATPAMCEPCPAGFYCPFGSSNYSGIPCSPGTYCKNNLTDGASIETTCPGGYYCPAKTGDPYLCPGMSCFFFFILCVSVLKHFTIMFRVVLNKIPHGRVFLAGYYCGNGSSAPAPCVYPYYCPEGSSSPQICPLGYKATTNEGNRTSVEDSCLICPAGFYGNHLQRLNCTICPKGYFCPRGTRDPYENECPAGYYCPAGSATPVSNHYEIKIE